MVRIETTMKSLKTTDTEYTSPEFATPMMQQYLEIKKQYQDAILLFRLGDFYEMFLEDAEIGAKVLDIVLTSRTRGKDGRIPMCGVPYHALDSYLSKLVKSGYKVAICEQLTEPGKGLVERKVIRVVTPGTLLDELALDEKKNNFLMSVLLTAEHLAVGIVDISTGEFAATQLPATDWQQHLATLVTQFTPSEYLVTPEIGTNAEIVAILHSHTAANIIPYHAWPSSAQHAQKQLHTQLHVTTLDGFGLGKHPQAWQAAAVLLTYLEETQLQPIAHITQLREINTSAHVKLDRSTILNLELFTGLRSSSKQGSFIDFFDQTKTAMGGRLLKYWITHPLTSIKEIEERQGAVAALVADKDLKLSLQDHLSSLYDLERIISKLALQNGSPKDVMRLAHALTHIMEMRPLLESSQSPLIKKLLKAWPKELHTLIEKICKTLVENPPFDPKQGGLIKLGFHSELDTFLTTIKKSEIWIENLEKTERSRTGIATLKVKFNKVFGFYIEVSRVQSSHVPAEYQRKQTLVNAERFITPELKQHEEIVLSAQEKRNALEYRLFTELVASILKHTAFIQAAAHAAATLDCVVSMAEVAERWHYTRPELNDRGEIEITQGRHPVVEASLGEVSFVPNDTTLNHKNHQLLVLTGPNMAGKSVFMRQTVLIVLLAHIGSYVPAEHAQIGLVDHIFVRSGATDGITSGLSTFMVEMTEAAYILNHATNKSLVVLDEIGRGTSTYDGISIAWAIAEYLVTHPGSQALTLFATHYHELQELEETFPKNITNYQMVVAQKDGTPVFVHTVKAGASPHSFGVAVAQLAGLPAQVITQAKSLLHKFEQQAVTTTNPTTSPSGTKGSRSNLEKLKQKDLEVITAIANLDIDQLTPLTALNTLATLKQKLKS